MVRVQTFVLSIRVHLLAVLLAVGPALACAAEASTAVVAPPEEPGVRIVVEGVVLGESDRPLAGVRIRVYQTDAGGAYTRERPMDEPNARLSATLETDRDGRFTLHTIRPGGYPTPVAVGGEMRRIPAHIHLDVRAPGYPEHRLQAVFDDDPLVAEAYWAGWVERLGHPVLTLRPVEGVPTAEVTLRLAR
jgi:protocatechuate 3,4-dioxygenase beta subunit